MSKRKPTNKDKEFREPKKAKTTFSRNVDINSGFGLQRDSFVSFDEIQSSFFKKCDQGENDEPFLVTNEFYDLRNVQSLVDNPGYLKYDSDLEILTEISDNLVVNEHEYSYMIPHIGGNKIQIKYDHKLHTKSIMSMSRIKDFDTLRYIIPDGYKVEKIRDSIVKELHQMFSPKSNFQHFQNYFEGNVLGQSKSFTPQTLREYRQISNDIMNSIHQAITSGYETGDDDSYTGDGDEEGDEDCGEDCDKGHELLSKLRELNRERNYDLPEDMEDLLSFATFQKNKTEMDNIENLLYKGFYKKLKKNNKTEPLFIGRHFYAVKDQSNSNKIVNIPPHEIMRKRVDYTNLNLVSVITRMIRRFNMQYNGLQSFIDAFINFMNQWVCKYDLSSVLTVVKTLDFQGNIQFKEASVKLKGVFKNIEFINRKVLVPQFSDISQESQDQEIFEKIIIDLEKVWNTSRRTLSFKTIDFHPSRENSGKVPLNLLNTFTGFRFDHKDKNIKLDHQRIKNIVFHIFIILCKGDNKRATYVIKYIAHMFQNPHIRTKVAIIFCGDKGGGKSTIWDIIADIFGLKYVSKVRQIDDVVGKFNNSLVEGKLFTVSEETCKQYSELVENKMKDYLTAGYITTEKKGIDQNLVHIYTNLVGTSNADDPIRIDGGNRRYVIIKIDNRFASNNKQTTSAEKTEYFDKIYDVDREALYNCFMNIDISDFNPSIIPKSEEMAVLVQNSFGLFDQFWNNFFQNNISDSYLAKTRPDDDGDFQNKYVRTKLFDVFKQFETKNSSKADKFRNTTQNAFWAHFQKVCLKDNQDRDEYKKTVRQDGTNNRAIIITNKHKNNFVQYHNIDDYEEQEKEQEMPEEEQQRLDKMTIKERLADRKMKLLEQEQESAAEKERWNSLSNEQKKKEMDAKERNALEEFFTSFKYY